MINRNKHSNPDSELYRAMLTLRTPEECHNFLCDLCTQSELNAIEQRYDVAKMLSLGKIYNEILAATNASSATVSRRSVFSSRYAPIRSASCTCDWG